MKSTALLLAAAISLSPYVERALRETNSHSATERGVKQYQQKQYAAAAKSFGAARAAAPAPSRAFNLGTAQIASGDREKGAATLSSSMVDRSLRPAALFNRGNGALASNAYDSAIRDYTESLRLDPAYMPAKRNLEIALARKQSAQQSQSGANRNLQGGQPQQHQGPQAPGPGKNRDDQMRSDTDADALLRSVQQQEQEELRRMRAQKREGKRVGW
jgi:tetratricopeptide (TPR) repeat protein